MTSRLIRNACQWVVVSILGSAGIVDTGATIYVEDDAPADGGTLHIRGIGRPFRI